MHSVKVHTKSSEASELIGEQIGKNLKGGEIIEFVSDLGGGKTTITRGIVRGSGSSNQVNSPTFTISKVYKSPKYEIHHFDFYRLAGAGLIEHEIHDLIGDKSIVMIVEWGEVVAHVLPDSRLTIEITKSSENDRVLILKYPKELEYIMKGLI